MLGLISIRFRDPYSRRRAVLAALVCLLAVSSGCATYSEKLADARAYTNAGQYPEAIDELNAAAGADSAEELPNSFRGDRPLAVLERAVLLQAVEEFQLSARDLSSAEAELEILDFEVDAEGKIGRFLFSDSSADYRASPTEKLALPGLNMMNYLALGDLSGAAVEGRRYTNTRDYLSTLGIEASQHFAAYLAGFVFEKLGEGDRALRYYEEALTSGPLESLAEPISRLARTSVYRGPGIESLLEESRRHAEARAAGASEILTVFALGRVPLKAPKRIPIGAAIGIAGVYLGADADILERSIFKVVSYPELVPSSARATRPYVVVDGSTLPVDSVSNLGADISHEYDELRPQILAAALSRLVLRAAAAEGARVAGQQAADGGEIIGLLAALIAEGSLVALDKPDTRSWSFLPREIAIARTRVEPGLHRVEIRVDGVSEKRTIEVEVPKGGFKVLVVTLPRWKTIR